MAIVDLPPEAQKVAVREVVASSLCAYRRLCERGDDKLNQKLIKRAKRDQGAAVPDRAKDREGSPGRQIAELEKQQAAAQRNLAIEELPELRDAVREEFQRINHELKTVRNQLEKVHQTRPRKSTRSMEQEVDAAFGLFDQIRQVADDENARAAVAPLLD